MSAILVANIFGIISFFVYSLSFFIKDKKKIVSKFIICNILDALEYYLLENILGVVESIVNIFQNIIFIKWNIKAVVAVIYIIKIANYIVNFNGIITVFLIATKITSFVGLCYLSEQGMRLANVFKSVVWAFFDYSIMAYSASVCDVISALIIVSSFIMYLKKGRKEDTVEKS